jgi:methionine-rich copper-binding protein CopC
VAFGALLALLLAFMAPVMVGTASAHSQLIDGDPRDGTTVQTAPSELTLTFNEDLQDLPGSQSNQIVVLNRDGDEVTTGEARVEGPKLIRPLGKLPAGTYDVQWSALSADGHRVSGDGNYAFTVTKGEEGEASQAPSSSAPASTPAASSDEAPASTESGTSQAASDDDPAGTVKIMWIVGGLLVLAVVLGIILQVTRKKKTEH